MIFLFGKKKKKKKHGKKHEKKSGQVQVQTARRCPGSNGLKIWRVRENPVTEHNGNNHHQK